MIRQAGDIDAATQNFHESFNGKLRDEFLNGEIFYTLPEAVVLVEQWFIWCRTERT